MAIAITLRVDAVILQAQAAKVQESVRNIQRQVQTLQKAVDNMEYWKGSAADMHKNDLHQSEASIESILQRLAEYPTLISRMAGVYLDTEQTNATQATQLVSDIPLR